MKTVVCGRCGKMEVVVDDATESAICWVCTQNAVERPTLRPPAKRKAPARCPTCNARLRGRGTHAHCPVCYRRRNEL